MNLRSVHAGVILFSAALAAFFGVWCLMAYRGSGLAGDLLIAILAFVVAVGLVVYDRWFLRKTRSLR